MLEVNVEPAVACSVKPCPAVPENVNRPGWPVVSNCVALPSSASSPVDVRSSASSRDAPLVPDGTTRKVYGPGTASTGSCHPTGALQAPLLQREAPPGW